MVRSPRQRAEDRPGASFLSPVHRFLRITSLQLIPAGPAAANPYSTFVMVKIDLPGIGTSMPQWGLLRLRTGTSPTLAQFSVSVVR